MTKTPYAIFMDIDGTLLNSNHEIEPKTLQTLREIEKQGHHLFIATGRMFFSAEQIARKISAQTNFIASNGAIVQLYDNQTLAPLSISACKDVYQLAQKAKLPLFFFSHSNVYYSDFLPAYFKTDDDRARISGKQQRDFIKINASEDFDTIVEPLLNAIIISEQDMSELQDAKKELASYSELAISSSAANNIEITQQGVNKATAIAMTLQHLGLTPNHAIAFGDGDNDIEMLRYVKYGIAMANATDAVKAIAQDVTASNNDEGIYQFLKQFFKLN